MAFPERSAGSQPCCRQFHRKQSNRSSRSPSGLPSPDCARAASRLFSKHFPSFRLLEVGPVPGRFAAIPLLMFSAPFIIMRNTIRGRRIEGRRAEIVMVATVIAGLWSLMSGTVVVLALKRCSPSDIPSP